METQHLSTATQKAESNDQLWLNPGAPQRKPRSVGKLCLWLTLVIIVLAGIAVTYFIASSVWYVLQNPHSQLYHKKPESEITDWSNIVRPMIAERDTFDIVASVWVRDSEGKAGGIYVDGEERSEKLIFSETVFRNLSIKSKNEFANVILRVPTNHFKQTNISNYDLRASFVLVQPHRPSWLKHATRLVSWKPNNLHSPRVRYWSEEPSLEGQIYDSFGITIPLIQFHNIPSKLANDSANYASDVTPPVLDLDEEDDTEDILEEKLDVRNSFELDFAGGRQPITQHHPYIVTRTHLGVVDDTNLYNRALYMLAQKRLANQTCNDPKNKKPYEQPTWYQCSPPSYISRGVFETMVQSRIADNDLGVGNRKTKWEYLYAPHLTALVRASGPKDLLAVPVDREANVSDGSIGGEGSARSDNKEYVSVSWDIAFSSHGASRPLFQDLSQLSHRHNLTAPHNKLEYEQLQHDNILGLFGYRISEDAHPRRFNFVEATVMVLGTLNWALVNHYWYTRASTTGISRFGTALLASHSLIWQVEGVLPTAFGSDSFGTTILFVVVSFFLLIEPLLMLKAALRLELAFREREVGKKSWIPSMYIAKATHLERSSDRTEARISIKPKILCLVALSTASYFFGAPYSYLISPRIPPPSEPNPLHSIHAYASNALEIIYSLSFACQLGGSMLQFIMNTHSKTYAGKYKLSTVFMFLIKLSSFVQLLPSIFGQSARLEGVGVIEGVLFLVSVVDIAQAAKYRGMKNSEMDEMEK